jgi:predicted nucleic acid-binding protein
MTARAFFDTNILLYAHDRSDAAKRIRAAELLHRYFSERRGVFSTQVLQEFYHNVSAKRLVSPEQARELVLDYTRLSVVTVQPRHILDAIDIRKKFRLGFWDSLILAAAQAAQATILFSEDFPHGQSYDGVVAQNPFV